MKKLTAILALAALVCGAAFADFTMTDWDTVIANGAVNVTDYAPAGFDVEAVGSMAVFGFGTGNISGWLFDGNEPFTVTLSGFEDNDFNVPDNSALYVYVGFRGGSSEECTLPWVGNGTYTFTPADFSGDFADEFEVTYVSIYAQGDGWVEVKMNSGAAGRVTFALGAPEEEEGTVVPEPCTIAYALTGLGSLAGIERRFKK